MVKSRAVSDRNFKSKLEPLTEKFSHLFNAV